MNSSYVFTPEAESDLIAIWEFIANDNSESAADHVVARILAECEKLSATPGIGHFRDDLLDDRHKFWSVWSYLIVYRWKARPIQIISIVHGARDLDAYFAQRPRE